MRPVAAYIRVSTVDQQAKWGPKVQRSRIQTYVDFYGQNLKGADPSDIRWYEDAESGTKASRKDFDRLREDARAGKFATVIGMDISRIGRNLLHLLEFEQILSCVDTNLVCVDQAFDSATPSGRMVMHMFGAFAQYDRAMLVSRMVHGKKAAQASGAAWGGPPPFGFVYAPTQDGTLLPVEDEVKIALKMIKMKKDGATQRGIADALNAEKLLPKSGRVITRTTVHHVLSKASRFMALRDIDVGVAGASR